MNQTPPGRPPWHLPRQQQQGQHQSQSTKVDEPSAAFAYPPLVGFNDEVYEDNGEQRSHWQYVLALKP